MSDNDDYDGGNDARYDGGDFAYDEEREYVEGGEEEEVLDDGAGGEDLPAGADDDAYDEGAGAPMADDEPADFRIVAGAPSASANDAPADPRRVPDAERTTTRFLTKYERARVLGTRALQLSLSAPPMVDVAEGESDPLQIAARELAERRLPLVVRRFLPDGAYEDWRLDELIVD